MGQALIDFGKPSLHAQFLTFHRANPHVYRALRDLALDLKRRGRDSWGIGGLFEVLRWQRAMTTTDAEFKLNNNLRAYYSRYLMQHEPELAGFFETREIRG